MAERTGAEKKKKHVRRRSLSDLLPSSDNHIPGYAGYVPQKGFHYGQTFGETTRSLLASMPSTSRPILQSTAPFSLSANASASASPAKTFSSSLERGAAGGLVLPPIHTASSSADRTKKAGYTGYIPMREEHFAEPYAETTRKALDDFGKDQERVQKNDETFRMTTARATSLSPSNPAPVDPLLSMSFKGRSPVSYPLTDDQQKTGYAGFVPRTLHQYGVAFPIATERAGREWDDMQAQHTAALTKRVELH